MGAARHRMAHRTFAGRAPIPMKGWRPRRRPRLRLALDCNWEFTFSSLNINCAASLRFKDADGALVGTAMVDDLAVPGGAAVTLNKSAAGLTFTPTGGAATVVKTLEFDGCVAATNAATTPPNTTKVTVIDTTPGYDFNYALEKSSCCRGSRWQ